MAAVMSLCHPGDEGVTLFLFINLSECPFLQGSVSVSVYLFVSPDIRCIGLSQTVFPLCLKHDLFRNLISTILNMLSVDHAFL